MSEAKVHTENEDAEHKNLSKKSRKVTNISVLRLITEKFTKELNVLWCKFTRENENQRTSNESDKRWGESNLEELMSVKPLHCVEAYIFSNESFFYKCTAFTWSLRKNCRFKTLQKKESKLWSRTNMSSKVETDSTFENFRTIRITMQV